MHEMKNSGYAARCGATPYGVINNGKSEGETARWSVGRRNQNERMKLGQNRRLHRMRVEISRLDQRYQPEAMRAAVAVVAGAGIMLRARRRVVVRLGWPVRLMVVAV